MILALQDISQIAANSVLQCTSHSNKNFKRAPFLPDGDM